MDRLGSPRQTRFRQPEIDRVEEIPSLPESRDETVKGDQPPGKASQEMEPFRGIKVRRRASLHRECKGDYLDVPAYPALSRIISKQGDREVLFADKVLKFTGSGKIKRRILLITEFALYLVDPETDILKRRIALTAVVKLRLSNLSDNFFAVIIPTEYDCLMASTRKTEIVTVLVEATNNTSDKFVELSNRFVYHAAADLVKEVQFETVEGNIKTRIIRKESED